MTSNDDGTREGANDRSGQRAGSYAPMELILAALGASQEIAYRFFAEQMGVTLNRLSVTVSGDIDLRRMHGVDTDDKAGVHNIRAEVFVDSTASGRELSALVQAATLHCPILQLLNNGTNVEIALNHLGDARADVT